jgi:hypothetical protein
LAAKQLPRTVVFNDYQLRTLNALVGGKAVAAGNASAAASDRLAGVDIAAFDHLGVIAAALATFHVLPPYVACYPFKVRAIPL